MSNKVTVSDLVARNKKIATMNPPKHPVLSDIPNLGMCPPQLVIFTCADPRCDPVQIFGLKSLETVVIRNPCGHVSPNVNGMLALDCLLGGFSEVMVMHHTDCGATMYTDAGTREALKEKLGVKLNLDDMTFGAITDLDQSVRDDIAVLKKHPLVRKELKDAARGFVYDVQTGFVREVSC